ncbi:DNA ligase LigA-related protein [Acidiphilium sp.]|uniref:DNA ligase LigA-related protein n=1 Tax=Acidiphilium sp. TaxID=527 RepID=UPI0025900CA7|nr:hypothetical protein [Acidiphilium sp.]
MTTTHDAYAENCIAESVNMLVPWYLVASYAYYHLDNPVLSDGCFDRLCQRFAEAWDQVEHPHKHLVDRESLAAGTCLLAEDKFPEIVKGAVRHLLRSAEKPKGTRRKRAQSGHTKSVARSRTEENQHVTG